MSNKAALLTVAKERPLKIVDVPVPEPKSYQVVIRVRAVAINPCDFGIQALGIIVKDYPSELGEDMAGEITVVGADVKHFKVGDRVLASSDMEEDWTKLEGSFQHYAVAHHKLVSKIPDTVSYIDASVLPLAMATAGTSLFDKRCMGLSLPHIGAEPTGSTLLVWGGASSVGACAIQLARGAGYDVITTCSKKNFDLCLDLGVKEVFDYNSPSVVDDIVKYLEGKKSAGVFDAIMAPDTLLASNEIAHRAEGYKHVGTVLPPAMPLPQGRPADVVTSPNWGTWLKQNEAGEAVFGTWIPAALANGDLKCKPDAQIVGRGLDKIQDAIDLYGKGVSGTKLVVEMD